MGRRRGMKLPLLAGGGIGSYLGTRRGTMIGDPIGFSPSSWTDESAYLPGLYYDELRSNLNAIRAGWGDAVAPAANDGAHEAAIPSGLSDYTAATAAAARTALIGGSGRRVTLTANVGAISLNNGDTITNSVLVIPDGITCGGFYFAATAQTDTFQIRGPGQIGCVTAEANTLVQPDFSLVGLQICPDYSGEAHWNPLLLNYFTRLTIADCTVRGIATAAGVQGGACFFGAHLHRVSVLNSSFGTDQDANGGTWAWRTGGGDGPGSASQFRFVNSYFRGSRSAAAIRQSHMLGMVVTSLDADWDGNTSLQSTVINTNEPHSFQDVGDGGVAPAPTLVTDDMGIYHARIAHDDQLQTNSGIGGGNGSLGWVIRSCRFQAADSSMLSDAYFTTEQATVEALGCDADYGVGTHTYSYADPVVPFTPPTTRASALLGTSISGDPYAI